MDILEKQNLVTIWLTNADQQNPAVQAQLKEIYAKYKDTNYKVGVFRSGKGDLYEGTLELLKYNKKRSAELEVAKTHPESFQARLEAAKKSAKERNSAKKPRKQEMSL